MRPHSLLRQAIGAVLLIESLSAVAFIATSLWHERQVRVKALDVSLMGRSDSLVGAVQDAEDPQDRVMVDRSEFNPPASDVYAVYSPDGTVVAKSERAPAEVVAASEDGFRTARVAGHRYRILQREGVRIIDRYETGGVGLRRPVTVVYAERTDHIWHEVLEGVRFYIAVTLLLLMGTALVLIFTLRRLLVPLNELATGAAGIRADALAFAPPASALRTRELTPLADALANAMARLRQAFESQHRFVSDAAHELKTAVAVVRSTIEVLGMRNRSEAEYRRGLDQVLADNERVETLVSRMLAVARFDERREPPAREIDLARETAEALRQLDTFAESRGVALRPCMQGETWVRMAPEAAQVLVSNLAMNAVQHSPLGAEVGVTIAAGADEKVATLTVQDHGAGIPAEDLPHVFDRFFRADKSRSRETGGAGLGLAICRAIVQGAGGSIAIESVYGKGSTVTVRLPLC